MNSISLFFTYGLMAIFAQNIVLTGGIGASRLLRAARKHDEFPVYCLLVFIFALLGQIVCYPFRLLLSAQWAATYLRPLVYAIAVALVYLLARFVIERFMPDFYEKYSSAITQSALNGVVFGVPLISGKLALTFLSSVGFALGAGIGFAVCVFLVGAGLKRIDNPDVPTSFRGIPAALLYLGILSLAFAGLTGQNLYM